LAADEIDWDYAPSGMNQINGEKYHFQDDPASKGMLNPNATVYRKVVFREYTDPSFQTLKTRPEHWTHLGILGPLIRAEVGDTIRVVFKNNGSRSYSVHPHGVFYSKDSEGAAYQDNTSGKDKADDAVAPGATYTYVWPVPERAGPAEGEGSTAFWNYHSHVDEGKDINSGLIGPLVITRRGMALADGFSTQFPGCTCAPVKLLLVWYMWSSIENGTADPTQHSPHRLKSRQSSMHCCYTRRP
jgi:manganese oxidase